MSKSDVSLLFPTPFFRTSVFSSEMNKAIVDYVENQSAIYTGKDIRTGYSNTGWHSDAWTLENCPGPLRSLFDLFRVKFCEAFNGICGSIAATKNRDIVDVSGSFVGWAVKSKSGDFNVRHIHVSPYRDTWAIVYYANVPAEQEVGGELRIFNPNLANRVSMGSTFFALGAPSLHFDISPRIGDLLIFPGWLEHAVLPCKSGQRIVVAANIGVERLIRA